MRQGPYEKNKPRIQFPVCPHQMRRVICEMGPVFRKGCFVSVLGLVKRSPSQRARPFQH